LVKLFVDGQHIDFLRLKEYDCSFKYFSLVHPMGKHILTVSYENNISVFCVESGQKISTIPVIEQTYIKSNPAYPYAAVGDSKGSVFLVSLLDIENPKILTEFHLSHFRIEKIIFSKSGETFIASDEESNIFVMRGVPGEEIKVICHYKEESQIIPEFILETNDLLTFYIMKNSEDSGTYLSKFLVPLHGNGKDKLEKTEIHFHKSLTKLLNVPGHENLFYTAQQMSKNVEIIRIVGEKSFETVKSIETPHQLKSLQFNLCGRYLYTWGTLDGIISIFDTQKNHELVAKFVAHNRHTFGVKKASMAFNQ
jgi:WD40 repeat protein